MKIIKTLFNIWLYTTVIILWLSILQTILPKPNIIVYLCDLHPILAIGFVVSWLMLCVYGLCFLYSIIRKIKQ